MSEVEAWPVWADRVNPHFTAALSRSVDHGVPVTAAAFLGLIFFAGAASTAIDPDTSLQEILTLRKAMNDALDGFAAAAVAREVEGKIGDRT